MMKRIERTDTERVAINSRTDEVLDRESLQVQKKPRKQNK